jgi:3-oxoacyl-[acyl-carrier protein] reductase
MKSVFFYLFVAILLAISCSVTPATGQNSKFNYLPAFYNAANYPIGNLAGKNVVLTGGSRGQGHAIATFFTQQGAKVYEISRTASFPGLIWHHFTGDITSQSDVDCFVDFILGFHVKIDDIILNAGELNTVYFQDNNPITLDIPYQVNLQGNFRVYDTIARANLLNTPGVRVGATASVGALSFFGPIEAYDHSKAAILDLYHRLAIESFLNPKGINFFTLLPFGVNTNISCNPYPVCIETQVCQAQVNALRPVCPEPLLPPGEETSAQDVAQFWAYIVTTNNVNNTHHIIDSNFPLDAQGNNYQTAWTAYFQTLSPADFAVKWKASAFTTFYGAPNACTANPGVSIVPPAVGERYCFPAKVSR